MTLRTYVPPAVRARFADHRDWRECEEAVTRIATEVAEQLERRYRLERRTSETRPLGT